MPKPFGLENQEYFPQAPAEGNRDAPTPTHSKNPVYFYHSYKIGKKKKKKQPPHLAINELMRKLCALPVDGLRGETRQTHLDLKCALLGSCLITPWLMVN